MKKIEVVAGSNIESVVYTLLAAKARGENVYCEFNGVELFSNDVTMDSAYKKITGMTKEEFDKSQEKNEKLSSVQNWIERGKKIIFLEKHKEWKSCVESRSNSIYKGEELNAALEIMEALENGASMEEVKKIFHDQNHSSNSYGIVQNIVYLFSSKGPEFYEATSLGKLSSTDVEAPESKKQENKALVGLKETSKSIDELKATATKAKMTWKYGSHLEGTVKELLELNAAGKSVYFDFNGIRLYSCDVTMDSAFKEVTGLTKEEFDKHQEEESKKFRLEREQSKQNIQIWKERGKKIIFPERHKEWEECVEIRANDFYNGVELNDALEIMEALANGEKMENVQKIFQGQEHSGVSRSLVRNIVYSFSGKGPEFYEATFYSEKDITPEVREAIEKKKQENKELLEKIKKVIDSQDVIAGLKFIAEHQSMSSEELKEGLLQLGCNFSLDDIRQQFPEQVNLFEGMNKGDLSCGASLIVNARDSEYGKSFVDDRFLSVDDDISIYHFIRVVTGDETYTKENIEKVIAQNEQIITMRKVINGLKFIAENQSMSLEELSTGLLELGCNFTLEDIKEQFPKQIPVFYGMKQGNIASGASVIVNMRDSEYGRSYVEDRFLSQDDESSVYNFIRIVTEDETYTKENIEKLSSNVGKKR